MPRTLRNKKITLYQHRSSRQILCLPVSSHFLRHRIAPDPARPLSLPPSSRTHWEPRRAYDYISLAPRQLYPHLCLNSYPHQKRGGATYEARNDELTPSQDDEILGRTRNGVYHSRGSVSGSMAVEECDICLGYNISWSSAGHDL